MKLKQSKLMFIMSGVAFALFAIFTALVMTVDVKVVGPDGAKVGFADFNTKVFNALGTNHAAEIISDILGYLIILFGAIFVGLFLYHSFFLLCCIFFNEQKVCSKQCKS